jgi:hypothetical protein
MERDSFIGMFPEFEFIYDLIKKNGGTVFNRGLFKIHTFEYVKKWTDILIHNYFKNELAGQSIKNIICFASNWQGCMYCIDSADNQIVYFDPATTEFFQAKDVSVDAFFDEILVGGEYDVIAEEYYQELCDSVNFNRLEYEDSFGHITYLHLGGEDSVENYEIVNTDVLWELQIQVSRRINAIGNR